MTDTTQTFEERPTRALLPVPRLRRPNTEQVTLVLLALLVAAVSLGPLLRLIWAALMPDGAFDTARLKELLWSRRVLEAIWNTVYISLSATVLAVVVGTAAALLVGLTDMRFRTAFVFGFVLPLMIPPQVTALAWIQSFSPASPILGALGLSLEGGVRHPLYSAAGIILLLGLYNAPLVFLTVRASLRRLPGELIEAGRAAGGRPFRLLLEIVLPLLRAGIFAGAALAFVSSIGNFGIQAMLGIPARVHTMITLIYRRLNAYGPSALNDMALLAVVLAVLTIAGVALAGWLGSRGDQRVSG
ncbi:ABC transporter permease, partial [Nitratireductor sp. GCM10026969]|uniref:ABC transporter permease n=1 Tax=Nitratireductor sp. GCM10026969 TaxID=3252645 RepID=UPI00360D1315